VHAYRVAQEIKGGAGRRAVGDGEPDEGEEKYHASEDPEKAMRDD